MWIVDLYPEVLDRESKSLGHCQTGCNLFLALTIRAASTYNRVWIRSESSTVASKRHTVISGEAIIN